LIDEGGERGSFGWILDERAGCVAMARAETRTDGKRAGAVPLRGTCGCPEQLVRHLGHGADYDHWLLSHGYASGDDGRGTLNGRRVLDRRAAKLHDYQAHANLPIVPLPKSRRISADCERTHLHRGTQTSGAKAHVDLIAFCGTAKAVRFQNQSSTTAANAVRFQS
jgi:hypothetical protein